MPLGDKGVGLLSCNSPASVGRQGSPPTAEADAGCWPASPSLAPQDVFSCSCSSSSSSLNSEKRGRAQRYLRGLFPLLPFASGKQGEASQSSFPVRIEVPTPNYPFSSWQVKYLSPNSLYLLGGGNSAEDQLNYRHDAKVWDALEWFLTPKR